MSNNPQSTKPAWMSNKVYDFLKWAVLIAIPAFGTFYQIMANVWHLPAANEVATTCLALATLLGALIGVATVNYNKSDSKFDGTLQITNAADPTVPTNYNFNVGDLDALEQKGEVTLKVDNPDASVK